MSGSRTHVYDKAKYHMAGLKSDPPSWEHASGHMLFFLRWVIDNQLTADDFDGFQPEELAPYRAGTESLYQWFERCCDLVFTDDMPSEEGNAFAQAYYDYDVGRYLDDLHQALGEAFVPYTEEAYASFRPTLDERYAAWKADDTGAVTKLKPPKKWWQFWK